MNLLIVDASQKRAAVRSRRVLSRWFSQLGPDTYSGRLSQEGLKDLVKELRAQASRQTSIAIHRVATRDRLELVGLIGNKDAFDGEGRWAFRTRARPPQAGAPTPTQELLSELVCLSGLVHDLGKANLQFQLSLQKKAPAQQLRHELLSFVMLLEALMPHVLKTGNDLGWLQAAQDPQALFASLVHPESGELLPPEAANSKAYRWGEWLRGTDVGDKLCDNAVNNFLLKAPARKKAPVLVALSWLVLTHHHLVQPTRRAPGKDAPGSIEMMTCSLWRQVKAQLPAQPSMNLRAPTEGLPWQNATWCEAVRRCCAAIEGLMHQHPGLLPSLTEGDGSAFLAPLSLMLRPALVLGDQLASIMQEDVLKNGGKGREHESGKVYANSFRKQADLAGDDLHTHLLSTGWRSRHLAKTLLNPDEGAFPRLDTELLPENSLLFAAPAKDSPFAWQVKAAERVAAIEGVEHAPFFAAVLCAPGSGKTAGGPRLLAAASGQSLRFTLGLGRRSLTLQTGRDYKDKLGMADEDLAVMVGDVGSRMVFEAQQAAAAAADSASKVQALADQANEAQLGSESLSGVEDDFLLHEDVGTVRGYWLAAIQPERKRTALGRIFEAKQQRLVDTPVLVATVDHLAGAASMLRTPDARLMLRVATSDLILDEVDDYKAADLMTLGKLVFLHGLYGRRVVLMSGTLSDFLVARMHSAWLKGLHIHQQLTGRSEAPVTCLVSNLTEPCVEQGLDEQMFVQSAQAFCREFSRQLDQQGSKVWPAILPLTVTGKEQPPAWPEEVMQGVFGLHRAHHVVDECTGVRMSFGAVRLNTVRHAQTLARHAFSRSAGADEPEVRVLCYHARYPTLHRALIEELLDRALNREHCAVPQHESVRQALDAVAAQGGKDLVIMLATTSIEETGRNHDLDWGIAEPSSERSAVQFGGRILRHRAVQPGSPNLLLLSTTLNKVMGTGLPYGRTGVQDNPLFKETDAWLVTHPASGSKLAKRLQEAGITFEETPGHATCLAQDLLPLATWGARVTPGTTLTSPRHYEDSRLACLQHFELMDVMGASQTAGPDTLQGFLASGASRTLWLDARHALLYGFRDDSSAGQYPVCLDPREPERFVHVDDRGRPTTVVARHARESLKHPHRALLRLDVELLDRLERMCRDNRWEVASALTILGKGIAAIRAEAQVSLSASFGFHPLLGFSRLNTGSSVA